MLVHAGELRLMALDFVNDPGVIDGATLAANEAVEMVTKRGEDAVTDAAGDPLTVIQASPAPQISGTQIMFWCDFTDVPAGRYWLRGTVDLSNDETAKAEAIVIVE